MTDRSPIATSGEALERLAVVRDRALLRAHLFSMDARQRWRELERELALLEEELTRSGEKALELATEKAAELVRLAEAFLERYAVAEISLRSPAQQVMTAALRTCGPNDTLSFAAQIMWDEDCGAVPVVDSTDLLLAILTDRDVCMACYTQGKAPTDIRVVSAMSQVTYSARQDASLATVISLMKTYRVRRVPITSEAGRLLGMISVSDLLRALPKQRQMSGLEDALVEGLQGISEKHHPSRTLRTAVAAE